MSKRDRNEVGLCALCGRPVDEGNDVWSEDDDVYHIDCW